VALLILAIVVGLIAGLARAQLNHRPLRVPAVSQIWLVLVAFAAQAVVFQIPATRRIIPDSIASGIFIGSQLLLMVFIWINRRSPGFWSLGVGLFLNLIAIVFNGGWMPISTETMRRLFPPTALGSLQVGKRFAFSKDQVFDVGSIRLDFLADRFLLPGWIPYRVAFSVGDVLISFGAFLLFWSIGSPQPRPIMDQIS
jgi:hypothetical protein